MPRSFQTNNFIKGLVFGFDVGTGSIGWAVRRGAEFLDVGVLICDSGTGDLSKRRELRRQRRTLRSRKYRRKWFADELEKSGISRPQNPPQDPIIVRLRALNGESVLPEELHAALTHLFKWRGYTEVPWANKGAGAEISDKTKEEGETKQAVAEIRKKMADANCQYPCQFLAKRHEEVGKSPTEKWVRKIYWPRELLENEFRAILKAQEKTFPKLAGKADWLLYGDTQIKNRHERTYHVFFKSTEGRNPGILGMHWPRFDNRGPGLDSLQPVDEQGRPLHVVRKNKDAFIKAQWELALMNFRVIDANTRQKLDPQTHFPDFIESLRSEWSKKGKVTIARLKKLAAPFKSGFLLIEGQKPLTPETGAGRARYSSPTLETIRLEINAGRRVDSPQPILRRQGESAEQALNRYLADIRHPLVRHRLILFRRLLAQIISRYGEPDMLVLEAVRSLALGAKAKRELEKRNDEFRKQRENARADLTANRESASSKAILRYRLWHEAKGRCPICLETIERTDLGHGADIAHLVPRSRIDCNEIYNLTIAHIKCNRELQGDRTPFAAFGNISQWDDIRKNAENYFSGLKLEIFLSPNAEELIEQKSDLQHTAYIARVIRHISLIQLSWLNEEGKDPTPEKQNPALHFQVTNGQLTSRLRQAWGVNQILHPLPDGKRWEDISEEEQKQFQEKNRGDLRHHALDAMVIACTLPWLAHRTHGATDEFGNHGWWTQDEKRRSKAANPLFPQEGQMHKICKEWMEKVIVRHHVSRSNHKQAYNTTLYAKKADDTYVAREVFTTLIPKNLGNIWPKEFAAYCEKAWESYKKESSDIDGELKKTKGCVPETFTRKLCFSHFQKWRADGMVEFAWPKQVNIPVRSVKLISVKDNTAVMPFSSGTHAFVERTGFKEVRIHLAEDGKSFVPVFIPYWRCDKPFCNRPIKKASKPIIIIRRGMVVETKKASSAGHPPNKYSILVTGQERITILPHHIANKEEAILSFGLPKKALQFTWSDFISCLGYELPHHPSDQAESASAAPA